MSYCPACREHLTTPAAITKHNARVALDGERAYARPKGLKWRTNPYHDTPRMPQGTGVRALGLGG